MNAEYSVKASLVDELRRLYFDGSKHSVYQNLPEFVEKGIGIAVDIDEAWRSDKPRYRYLTENYPQLVGRRIADIGANTGYFSLSIAKNIPNTSVVAYECNATHARLIETVCSTFNIKNLVVHAEAIDTDNTHRLPHCDVLLFLNVLHHLGVDFDHDRGADKAKFFDFAVSYLEGLSKIASYMWFQMGTNLGGDKSRPITANDTPLRVVDYLVKLLDTAHWNVENIGFARLNDGEMHYQPLPESLIAHVLGCSRKGLPANPELFYKLAPWAGFSSFPGEFYRRPMVLCSSRQAARR